MIVRITSKYGVVDSVHKTPHTGIDLAMNEGTPLRSISDGVITKVMDYGSQNVGKGVIIQHQDGTQSIYGHLSEINVKPGEFIQKGETFALSGNTGHSTGPHLHLGLKNAEGQLMDPHPIVDDVANYAGEMNMWERIIANGKVGDGYGDLKVHTIGEMIREKASEFTINGFTDYLSDFALAFPIIATVSFGVYALVNMFSKNAAKWGALGTMAYGALTVV